MFCQGYDNTLKMKDTTFKLL
jgi:hypothetical protein